MFFYFNDIFYNSVFELNSIFFKPIRFDLIMIENKK